MLYTVQSSPAGSSPAGSRLVCQHSEWPPAWAGTQRARCSRSENINPVNQIEEQNPIGI